MNGRYLSPHSVGRLAVDTPCHSANLDTPSRACAGVAAVIEGAAHVDAFLADRDQVLRDFVTSAAHPGNFVPRRRASGRHPGGLCC